MANCFSQPGLLPFEQAKSILLENITSVDQVESVAIENALGRVLATEIMSPVNVPPHDNSAMDGYAFALSSIEDTNVLKLVGKSFAGTPFQGIVEDGQCIRIMTGAKLPNGCDTVEMQENCQVEADKITFLAQKKLGQNVRLAGEDIKQSEVIYHQGYKLSAPDVGALASVGIASVDVFRKVNVALIATGDELKSPNETLMEGDIFESNRFFLKAMLTKVGANVIDFGIIKDDFDLIKQAFIDADKQADIVISSGGVSVGEADYTKDVLESLGQVGFWKIAMKPGKPFAFGKLENSFFCGLPGNPVSALVTFYQLVVPSLFQLMGAGAKNRITLQAKTTSALKKSIGRMDFQRGVWQLSDSGEIEVTSTGAQGSGILTSVSKANCFILLAQDQGRVEKGEQVTIELFDELLGDF